MSKVTQHSLDGDPITPEAPGRGYGFSPPVPGMRVGALVLMWSHAEPHRVGERILIREGTSTLFGRGEQSQLEGTQRVGLERWRPGPREGTSSLGCPHLSRNQFLAKWGPDDTLLLENIGRLPMLLGTEPVGSLKLAAGDTFMLGEELMFMYVPHRSPRLGFLACDKLLGFEFGRPDPGGLVGESEAIWALRHEIHKLSRIPRGHGLLLGRSGSGKEGTNRLVRSLSGVPDGRYAKRNAAEIGSGDNARADLGGITAKAATGVGARPGICEVTDGGLFFLDEVASLNPDAQCILLRAMDVDGEYSRCGEDTTRKTSMRVVAATGQSLESLRKDLLRRFNMVLTVPSLSERLEDIPLIARHLVLEQARRGLEDANAFVLKAPDGSAQVRFSPHLIRSLLRQPYKGEVRELSTLLERAIFESIGGKVLDYPPGFTSEVDTAEKNPLSPIPNVESNLEVIEGVDTVEKNPRPHINGLDAEQHLLLEVVREYGFNVRAAVKDPRVGCGLTSFYEKFRQVCGVLRQELGGDLPKMVSTLLGDAKHEPLRPRVERLIRQMLGRLEAPTEPSPKASSLPAQRA